VDTRGIEVTGWGWTNLSSYIRHGVFIGTFVIEYKSKKVLKPIIDDFRQRLENSPNREQLKTVIFPDLFKYRSELRRFDLKNNKVTCHRQQYFDRDGTTMMRIENPINDVDGEKYFAEFPPTAKYDLKSNRVLLKTAKNIEKIFKNAMDDPKISLRVKEIKELERERESRQKKEEADKKEHQLKEIDTLKPIDASSYMQRGLKYLKLGDNNKSILDFNKAIEIDNQYADAYGNRGLAYQALGKDKQAIADFNKAIELNPQDAISYYSLGNVYFVLGNYNQAITNYDEAIERDKEFAFAYGARGDAHSKLGNNKQAIADWKIAAKLGDETSQYSLKKKGIAW
jgi:tetratricopeptide (TPR) repeat protein